MIARVWSARAEPDRANLYATHFTEAVLPRLVALPGCRGAYLLRRVNGAGVEFVVQTLWDSMDAVKQFAGATPDVAVVDDEARAVLTSFDSAVKHYEVSDVILMRP
jgi:heme-degrading monooxygenase HmoA